MNHELLGHRIDHFAPITLFVAASWQMTRVSPTGDKSDLCSGRAFPNAKRSQILGACTQTTATPCQGHGILHGLEDPCARYHVAHHRSEASGAQSIMSPSPRILLEW